MKKTFISPGLPVMVIALLVLAVFIFKTGRSQNESGSEPGKTVKVKIISESDGKTKVIDTTIVRNKEMSREEVRDLINDLKEQIRDWEEEIKNLSLNIAVEMADSSNADSLAQRIEKSVRAFRGFRDGRPWPSDDPEENEFMFNFPDRFPEPPDFPFYWNDRPDREPMPERAMRGRDLRRFMAPGESGSLNDLLGDIPMDRVKNYTIKDRKNGKRIIIDLEDAPFFPPRHGKIIVHAPKGKKSAKYKYEIPEKDVRVIIETEKEKPETN